MVTTTRITRCSPEMNFFPVPVRSYAFKEFHKTNYESPSSIVVSRDHNERDNRRKDTFIANGIDKSSISKGLQYGSGQEYPTATRLAEKTTSEIVKQKRHQKEADENIKTFQELKMKNEQEAIETKKKDFEMLKYPYPWGKQRGGGAPKISNSGTMNNCFGKLEFKSNGSSTNKDGYNPFGRPGGGAPIKSDSGTFVTALVGDPNIRFQKQLKKEINQTLKYKNKDSQVSSPPKVITRTPSEIERREIERKKKEIYAKKLEEQRVDSQERKRKLDDDEKVSPCYNPWGRGIPTRDDSGKLQRRQRGVDTMGAKTHGGDNTDKGLWLKGLGEPPIIKRQNNTENKNEGEDYNPWGKPGCGAPLANSSGKTLTNIRGSLRRQQQQENEATDSLRKAGHGITVAELLRNGKVGQPIRDPNRNNVIVSHGKNTSDVTALSLDIRGRDAPGLRGNHYTDLQEQADQRQLNQERERKERIEEERKHLRRMNELWPQSNTNPQKQHNPTKQQEYYNDLQQMIDTRIQQNKIEKKKLCERESKHVTAFNQMWGRPGGGAPRTNDDHKLDTSPRSYGTLTTFMTHTGQHKFRRS